MDAASIITQVCREENISNSPVPKVEAKPPIPTVTHPNVSSNGKLAQGSLLSRLLCCFRPGVVQSCDITNHTINHTENGSFRTNKNHSHKNQTKWLLKPVSEEMRGRVCLVVDLDETLVHSSFQPVKNADFIIPVEIDGVNHQVYVLKRPHVDDFLQRVGQLFECVLFTASLGKYADPVTDLLDKWSVFQSRLFRESCVFHVGNYVKDLSLLGRDVDRVAIVDNSPISYLFHPKNAVPVLSWFEDPSDHELRDLLPFLEELAASSDVYQQLSAYQRQHANPCESNGKTSISMAPPPPNLVLSSPLNTFSSPYTPPNEARQQISSDVRSAGGDNNPIHAVNKNTPEQHSAHNNIISNLQINDGSKAPSQISLHSNNSNKNDNNVINNNNNNKHVSKSKKKHLIAETIVDCSKQQQQLNNNNNNNTTQQPQLQDNLITTTTTNKNSESNNKANSIHPGNNDSLLRVDTKQLAHKTSAPELQRLPTHAMPLQRHSYQPISKPLHQPTLSSHSSNNIHNCA